MKALQRKDLARKDSFESELKALYKEIGLSLELSYEKLSPSFSLGKAKAYFTKQLKKDESFYLAIKQPSGIELALRKRGLLNMVDDFDKLYAFLAYDLIERTQELKDHASFAVDDEGVLRELSFMDDAMLELYKSRYDDASTPYPLASEEGSYMHGLQAVDGRTCFLNLQTLAILIQNSQSEEELLDETEDILKELEAVSKELLRTFT